jgi:hypothetical protein
VNAAKLNANPRLRRTGQGRGHHVRRAPIESKRRGRHTSVANRHKLRHALRCLLFEQRDRIWPVAAPLPSSMARARHLRPTRPASRGAIGWRDIPGCRCPSRRSECSSGGFAADCGHGSGRKPPGSKNQAQPPLSFQMSAPALPTRALHDVTPGSAGGLVPICTVAALLARAKPSGIGGDLQLLPAGRPSLGGSLSSSVT